MKEFDQTEALPASQSQQNRAFAPSEMVECSVCFRANAPTRVNCLYCGATLAAITDEVTERIESVADRLSEPASTTSPESESEDVVHVIVRQDTKDERTEETIAKAAELLNLTLLEVSALLGTAKPAPVWSGPAAEAEITGERLRLLGVDAITVADELLRLRQPPKGIRALEFDRDDSLTVVFRRDGQTVARWEEIGLIVVGRLYVTTVEVERKRNRSRNALVDEREFTSDESVLDIYAENDKTGWRIMGGNFDYSCLGEQKKATAFENFSALVDAVRQCASNAVFDDSYVRLQTPLTTIWPTEPRASNTQNRRTARGNLEATATTTDNEEQFLRYSRLLRFLQESETDDDAGKA